MIRPKNLQRYHIARAWISLAQDRPDEAIAFIDAIKLDGGRQYQGLMAACLSAKGDHAEAERILRDLLATTRKSFGSFTFHERRIIKGIADELRRQNRHAVAAELLDENIDGMTHTALAWLLPDWAIVKLDLGEYDRVDEFCRTIATTVSTDGEALNTRVIAHVMRSMVAHATNREAGVALAASERSEMLEAYTRWPDDFGMTGMLAWTLIHAQPDDADHRARAMTLAQSSVAAIRNAGFGLGKDFRASFPYHIMARVSAVDGDFAAAVAYQRMALSKLSLDHLFLRGYYTDSVVDYLISGEQFDDAEHLLRASIAGLDARDIAVSLQFHRANLRLKLVEILNARSGQDQTDIDAIFDEARQILKYSPNRVSQERMEGTAELLNRNRFASKGD